MHPIIASDFGNLGAFVLGFPALFFALLIGIPCALNRFRTTAALCGIICLLAGALFLYSLSYARSGDFDLTVAFGAGGIVAGLLLIFVKRRRKESVPPEQAP